MRPCLAPRRARPWLRVGAPLLAMAAAAAAAGTPDPADRFQARIGVGVETRPLYLGAASRATGAHPVFGLSYRSDVFGTVAFGSDVGGLLWTPWRGDSAAAGLLLSYDPGRRDDVKGRPSRPGSTALRGLGRIEPSALYGGYLAADIGGLLEATAVVLRSAKDGGTRAQLGLSLPLPLPPAWEGDSSLAATARLQMADRRHMGRYFGVSAAQSQRAGRPAFDAGGGLFSAGLGVEASHALSAQWRVSGTAELEQLRGAAARSPVTERRLQPHLDLTLSYEF